MITSVFALSIAFQQSSISADIGERVVRFPHRMQPDRGEPQLFERGLEVSLDIPHEHPRARRR